MGRPVGWPGGRVGRVGRVGRLETTQSKNHSFVKKRISSILRQVIASSKNCAPRSPECKRGIRNSKKIMNVHDAGSPPLAQQPFEAAPQELRLPAASQEPPTSFPGASQEIPNSLREVSSLSLVHPYLAQWNVRSDWFRPTSSGARCAEQDS